VLKKILPLRHGPIHGAPLDHAFCAVANWIKFFSHGVGDWEYLQSIPERASNIPDVTPIQIQWGAWKEVENGHQRDGFFISPVANLLPAECQRVPIRLLTPDKEITRGKNQALCLHFAGTGDNGFGRRQRMLARPLLKHGIASLLIENPYYGKRAPKEQFSTYLLYLSDLIKLGHGAAEEGRSLLQWAHEIGFDHLAVTGISMGGQLAAFSGVLSPYDISIIPCIPPHSPEGPYLERLLASAVDWNKVHADLEQFGKDKNYLRELFYWMDIRRFEAPRRPDWCHIIAAKYDAYIPNESANIFANHWGTSKVTWLDAGHVSSVILHSTTMVRAIVEAIELQRQPHGRQKLAL
jgi:esterase/lipase